MTMRKADFTLHMRDDDMKVHAFIVRPGENPPVPEGWTQIDESGRTPDGLFVALVIEAAEAWDTLEMGTSDFGRLIDGLTQVHRNMMRRTQQ
jgi:hypothetical protein